MATVYTEEKPTTFITMTTRQFVQIVAIGLIVGLAAWGLAWLLDRYVYQAVLCHGTSSARCDAAQQYAAITATILAAAIGLFGLVRAQVFRPLLVVLAATVTLWSVVAMVETLPWYGAMIASTVLYILAYVVFSWFARIRSFILALVISVIIVVGVRLILNS